MDTHILHYPSLTPINCYRLLPNPPSISSNATGSLTGLTCPSVNCQTRPTHSTVYCRPRNGSSHLVGIKCKLDTSYMRSYFRVKLEEDFIYHNSRIHSGYGYGEPLSQNYRAMDLSKMLNRPSEPITPPPSQAQGSSGTQGQMCHGLHGTTAYGHSGRVNKGCSCCLKLNNGTIPCSKHKPDKGKKGAHPSNQHPISEVSIVWNTHHTTSSGTTTNAPLPQPAKRFAQRILSEDVARFRSLAIQRQADTRERSERDHKAKLMVTLIVWPGSLDDPFGFWAGRIHAPHWPTFALSDSPDIQLLVEQHLGKDWKGNLQVWNEDEQLWLHLDMNAMEQYPENSRKLLVVFPNINPNLCRDVEQHLATVSKARNKDCMSLSAFLTPSNRLTSSNKNKTHIILDLTTPEPDTMDTSSKTSTQPGSDDDLCHPDDLLEGPSNAVPNQATKKSTKRARSISPDSTSSASSDEDPKGNTWPNGVTMRQLKALFDETDETNSKKRYIRAAWLELFGSTHEYVPATASYYLRWMKKIDQVALAEYLNEHGEASVQAGREFFHKAWKGCSKRKPKNLSTKKRVKLDTATKRPVS
ncbi:hypothetical protein DFH28DRAFT_909662 [Melampsora americana]|nr:hypothetical protein DFH28DRAFT_909662 [Melampsora americana]